MKNLIYFLLLFPVFLTSCNKEFIEAEYIVAVSGSGFHENIYLRYSTNYTSEDIAPTKTLYLENGEATIKAYKKDYVIIQYPAHTEEEYETIVPENQLEGDKIHITVYKKKNNGNKGAVVAEADMTAPQQRKIDFEW